MDQNKIFSTGEGDAWYRRNSKQLIAQNASSSLNDVAYVCEVLSPFKSRINQVLEIGCSDGLKLDAICYDLDAIGVGIDPSSIAVNAGNTRAKIADITLMQGTGENLPCLSERFDLVYFAFCLYLFDRKSLIQSLAEADRVLKPGGFLVITDFDPGVPYKRPYSHCDGVYSYKQDYTTFYTQSGLYYLAGKTCFSHRVPYLDEIPDERVATSILYKEAEPYPVSG